MCFSPFLSWNHPWLFLSQDAQNAAATAALRKVAAEEEVEGKLPPGFQCLWSFLESTGRAAHRRHVRSLVSRKIRLLSACRCCLNNSTPRSEANYPKQLYGLRCVSGDSFRTFRVLLQVVPLPSQPSRIRKSSALHFCARLRRRQCRSTGLQSWRRRERGDLGTPLPLLQRLCTRRSAAPAALTLQAHVMELPIHCVMFHTHTKCFNLSGIL